MESIHELIDSLRHRQIRLWLEEDRLRFSAPEGAMSGELLARLRAHKPALMSMLAQTAGDAIPRVDRGGPLPLSPAQERLWMVGRLAGAGDASYNMPGVVTMRGPLPPRALERALEALGDVVAGGIAESRALDRRDLRTSAGLAQKIHGCVLRYLADFQRSLQFIDEVGVRTLHGHPLQVNRFA